MAAFTVFSEPALRNFLRIFELGDLVAYSPISTGIENSNYFVTLKAEDGPATDYVLTINESLACDEAPFFSQLLHQLAQQGLPVPEPRRTYNGRSDSSFCDKPTWLFPKLAGTHPSTVSLRQCSLIGQALAQLHTAAQGCRASRANPYDQHWASSTLTTVSAKLSTGDRSLFNKILAESQTLAGSDLPAGLIHGDLFRDNTLFEGEVLTGIIDFYHACHDFLAQDLAITINDWCTEADGKFDGGRQQALLDGYEQVRPLTEAETKALPALQRVAAMRFALTRFLSGDGTTFLKDPQEFLRIARNLT
jgi:homoserine kinase type II